MSGFHHGKVGGLTGKKVIALIFLVVGVMLMFFIISQGISVYKSSRENADRQGQFSARCVGYLYTISEVTSSDEELQFTFKNHISSTEDVSNLTVFSVGSRWSGKVSIPIGSSLAVRVPVKVDGNFSVYPDSCEVFPARCNLEGECSYK